MAVFEALPDEPIKPTMFPEPLPERDRLGNSVVQRVIVKVLAATNEPMRRADIRLAVEQLLRRPVSINSVGWCLETGLRAKQPRFERVSYGCYRLGPM
jgi:hypothetical protein